MLQPCAHNILEFDSFRNRVLLFRHTKSPCRNTSFAEGAYIESLAFGPMWIEVITRFTLGYSPLRIMCNRQDLSTQLISNPLSIFFVFFAIKRTGGVNQYAARLESIPYIVQYITLTLCTFLHILHTPFCHRSRIFAKHTLTRTWGIHQDTIEEFG